MAKIGSPERALQMSSCGALSGLTRDLAPVPRALPWAVIWLPRWGVGRLVYSVPDYTVNGTSHGGAAATSFAALLRRFSAEWAVPFHFGQTPHAYNEL